MDCDGGEPRGAGIWRYGPAWARHVCAAAPWLTLAILLLAFVIASTKFVRGPGVPFELPENGSAEAEDADVAAVLVCVPGARDAAPGTVACFGDARFAMSDAAQRAELARQMEKAVADEGVKSVLVLADAGVPVRDLMRFVDMARAAGFERTVVAEK